MVSLTIKKTAMQTTETCKNKFEVGQTITYGNRTYTIIDIEVAAETHPAIKKAHPHVELMIIVRGKRGALKDGFTTTRGKVVLHL